MGPIVFHDILNELTTPDKFFTLVYQLLRDLVVANEQLKSKSMKDFPCNIEQTKDAQQQYCDWEVDIEAIRNEWYDVHMSHYLTWNNNKEQLYKHNCLNRMT